MRFSRAVIVGLFTCSVIISKAQTGGFAQDLDHAQKIEVNKHYNFQKSPSGFGETQEFPAYSYKSPYYFEKERNTAWYLIEIPVDGTLTFEIKPHSMLDDYDWMLFEFTDTLNKSLKNSTAQLLRSNNSRNDQSLKSITGLREGFYNLFEKPGPGKSFSKPLEVQKGWRLALVLDNIYDGGSGFELRTVLKYSEKGILKGTVKDKSSGQVLKASIIIEDNSGGRFLTQAVSDENGNYEAVIPLNQELYITAQSPEYLFQSDFITISGTPGHHDFLLQKPQTGSKLVLYQIHFFPNKDKILPSSEAELDRLTAFLKQHPKWDIKITGHTNNNVFASTRYLQQLSFSRAIAVKNTLMQHGIPEKRISCAGLGGRYPVADTKDPVESLKNLRVEIELQGRSN